MASNISPGVYTKIIDLSTFVQAVPSTIGFMCALTEKGRDNELRFIGSRAELISEFGEPNINKYGKNYGQGLYCAYNYLGESGSLYFMRCLSENAQYANIRIDAQETDTTANIIITHIDSMNTKNELKTSLAVGQGATRHPICFLYPIGRGEYYNSLAIRITQHSNPTLDGVYVLDIYQKQSDGNDEIIESFEISFDPLAVDSGGSSIWIQSVLETYSTLLRAEMYLTSGAFSSGEEYVVRVYDNNMGDVSCTSTEITDNKQDFSQWEDVGGEGQYIILAIDAKGQKMWGWCGAASGTDNVTMSIYTDKNLAVQGWSAIGTGSFNLSSENITYFVKKTYGNITEAFISATPVPLKKGSDGDLINSNGSLNTTEADVLLSQGYSGIIDENVLDTENVYFSLVFDCGYPADVKDAIFTLCTVRRDCIGILDNGDNSSLTSSLDARDNENTYNTYLVALYECYNKVADSFTGQDVWFSPIYHMSYILPRNDLVGELWYAAAGYNRASIGTIKELRFNPRLGQRDQMYLKQLNPIVKFNPGYVVWGQLTSQAKASALQDINISRLVLYCKRALEQYCRNFIFEQNDSITWNLVKSDIVGFLESVKKRRGLYDYSIDVGATEYEQKTKTFHVDVTLNPTRVVEKIELNFFIK